MGFASHIARVNPLPCRQWRRPRTTLSWILPRSVKIHLAPHVECDHDAARRNVKPGGDKQFATSDAWSPTISTSRSLRDERAGGHVSSAALRTR